MNSEQAHRHWRTQKVNLRTPTHTSTRPPHTDHPALTLRCSYTQSSTSRADFSACGPTPTHYGLGGSVVGVAGAPSGSTSCWPYIIGVVHYRLVPLAPGAAGESTLQIRQVSSCLRLMHSGPGAPEAFSCRTTMGYSGQCSFARASRSWARKQRGCAGGCGGGMRTPAPS